MINKENTEGITATGVKSCEEMCDRAGELGTSDSGSQYTVELTSSDIEHVHNTFCGVVEKNTKWLDQGIVHFDRMVTAQVALEEVYVVPRLVKQVRIQNQKERRQKQVAEPGGKKRTEDREIEMEDFFEKQIEMTVKEAVATTHRNHMVILGDPGGGKTCLLQYIALKVSTKKGGSLGFGKGLLPVYIPLKEYLHSHKEFKEFVVHYINQQICSMPEAVFDHFLEKNKFLFLLDGLDEVESESERIHLSRQVELFMAQHPGTQIILTSRPAGYRTAALIGAVPHFTLAELNDDEIREFLVKRFTGIDEFEEDKRGKEKAEEKANNLVSILLNRERVLRLARTPLLLAFLVLIHRKGGNLPERRAEFYEYVVNIVADTWGQWKRLHSERKICDQEVMLAILGRVGFKMHSEKQQNTVEADELRMWVKKALQEEMEQSSRKEVDDSIWMLTQQPGFIKEKAGLYEFVNFAVQEYFAARHIACGRGTHLAHAVITTNVYSSRWREVFLLAAAIAPQEQADLIFDSILGANNDFEKYIHSNLLFAGEALAEESGVNESKKQDIIDRLKDLTGSDHIDALRTDALHTLTKIRSVVQCEDTWGLELLSDENWYVRYLAVQYFVVAAEDAEIKENICELLKDEDSGVRRQAVRYCTAVGGNDSVMRENIFELLNNENLDGCNEALEYFAVAANAEITEKFFELLSHKNSHVRFCAVKYFTAIKADDAEIREKMCELLTGEDRYGCYLAMKYLATVGADDAEITEKMCELLTGEDRYGCYLAMKYLATVGADDAEITEKFFELLKDEDWRVRSVAAEYFTAINSKDAEITEKFFELLKDEDWRVRSVAVEYFASRAKDPETKKKFLTLLKDSHTHVREQAVKYFAVTRAEDPEIKERFFELLKDNDSDDYYLVVEYLATVGIEDTQIREKMCELLEDEDWRVRYVAVEFCATAGIGDTQTTMKILELLKDKDPDVRYRAVRYFTKVSAQDPEITEKIFKLLEDEYSYVRYRALEYFTTVGAEDPVITEKMCELLKDEDLGVREQAASYLAAIGAEDTQTNEKIFELLKDKDPHVRYQAVRYFATRGIKDKPIRQKIFELLKDESCPSVSEPTIQDMAVEYLSRYAAKESTEKAPILFTSKNISTQRGAYNLMKALLATTHFT
jgi:HEAT repeat protein